METTHSRQKDNNIYNNDKVIIVKLSEAVYSTV